MKKKIKGNYIVYVDVIDVVILSFINFAKCTYYVLLLFYVTFQVLKTTLFISKFEKWDIEMLGMLVWLIGGVMLVVSLISLFDLQNLII